MAQVELNTYLSEIQQLMAEGRYAVATVHARQILHTYPRHVATYVLLGQALLGQRQYDGAAEIFKRVLSADPLNVEAHTGLAGIYERQAALPEAIWHTKRALEADPYNSNLKQKIRQLYDQHGTANMDEVGLSPTALARLHLQGGLYQQAVNELERLVQERPDRIDMQVLLAEAYWSLARHVEAVKVCEAVLAQLPYCVQANAILAETWLKIGRIAAAQKHLKRLQTLVMLSRAERDVNTAVGRAFITKGTIALPNEVLVERAAGEALQAAEASVAGQTAVAPEDDLFALGMMGSESLDDIDEGAGEPDDFFALLDAADESDFFADDTDEADADDEDLFAPDEAESPDSESDDELFLAGAALAGAGAVALAEEMADDDESAEMTDSDWMADLTLDDANLDEFGEGEDALAGLFGGMGTEGDDEEADAGAWLVDESDTAVDTNELPDWFAEMDSGSDPLGLDLEREAEDESESLTTAVSAEASFMASLGLTETEDEQDEDESEGMDAWLGSFGGDSAAFTAESADDDDGEVLDNLFGSEDSGDDWLQLMNLTDDESEADADFEADELP
ncbi:MAG: tetratricopeptide repeat protein, partial [Anaerolineales bacterium]|nr:tetratricopeptide repeat protein [Anaerolineales bacterium]